MKNNSDNGRLVDRNTVRFQRLLPGPVDLVWEYLTQRDKLSTWLVDGFIKPDPGAELTLSQADDKLPMRSEGEIRGVVTRCEPPHLLAYTWRFVPTGETAAFDPLKQSEVIFELEERGEDVLLTLTHRRIPSDHIPQAGASWHAHLEYLTAHMSKREAQAFFTNYERVLPVYVRAQRRREWKQ